MPQPRISQEDARLYQARLSEHVRRMATARQLAKVLGRDWGKVYDALERAGLDYVPYAPTEVTDALAEMDGAHEDDFLYAEDEVE